MKTWVGLFVLALILVRPSFAFDASTIQWNDFSDEFQLKEKSFRGSWQDSKDWKGTLCNGHYEYSNQLVGQINKVDFDLQENGSVDAYGDLYDIHTGLTGSYKSSYTACLPVKGWYGIGIDRAQIRANVTFEDREGNPVPAVKLKITSTELGHIHLANWMPTWIENVATGIANAGLKKVWGSFLGNWISDMIAKQIKKFPGK